MASDRRIGQACASPHNKNSCLRYIIWSHSVIHDWYKSICQIDILARLNRLPDAELVAQVKTLIRRERGVTAEVIAHLAELGTRDVHLREGYPSLYVYCRDALGLSEWEAYNRIEVAGAARRFPVILEMLAEGAVHLTAVRRLAPHLTPENHVEVLQSAKGKTKHEVEEIVARLAPRPDVPCSVRRVSGCSKGLSAAAGGRRGVQPAGSGEPPRIRSVPGHVADETGMAPPLLGPAFQRRQRAMPSNTPAPS